MIKEISKEKALELLKTHKTTTPTIHEIFAEKSSRGDLFYLPFINRYRIYTPLFNDIIGIREKIK